jgi:hypothetical protein
MSLGKTKGRYTPQGENYKVDHPIESKSPQSRMKTALIEISHESGGVRKLKMSSKVFTTGMDSVNAKGTLELVA